MKILKKLKILKILQNFINYKKMKYLFILLLFQLIFGLKPFYINYFNVNNELKAIIENVSNIN